MKLRRLGSNNIFCFDFFLVYFAYFDIQQMLKNNLFHNPYQNPNPFIQIYQDPEELFHFCNIVLTKTETKECLF